MSAQHDSPESARASLAESTVTIPGPLRSFLRMSGISTEISPQDVIPLLAHNTVLHGYDRGKPTEFLILLRRYISQAKDLSAMATGSHGEIHLNGCQGAEALLHALGYRIQGACGNSAMALVTADPERAFLTVDSGFPLVDLEQSLQHNAPFTYFYAGGTAVPVIFTPADWIALESQKPQEGAALLDRLLYQAPLARLYWGLSRVDPETRLAMKNDIGLGKLLPLAPLLDLYGSQICIRQGRVAVPGGLKAEREWQELVGASPGAPAEFVQKLLTKDRGWLAPYYDAMARASATQQEHFAERGRIKRYYAAFRSPGVTRDSPVRLAYRPAAALLVLAARMQWDENGKPYVPGNLQVWSDILHSRSDSKFMRNWTKRSTSGGDAERLAEAMFAFSRLETETGPLQAYLCLSELDHRRGLARRLSDSTVLLLARRYADFSDQFLLFLEFPELNDDTIVRFLKTAEALGKIPDHTIRGNAMGIFQADIGLWQIAARQGQIGRSQLNPSFREVIKPFADVTTAAQLVTAGRGSTQEVFRAAGGKATLTQEKMVDQLAGTHQTSAEGRRIHKEVADRIQLVMEDQRLVSIDTVFALDEGLKNLGQAGNSKDELVALATELREFEMPQPIFTNSERIAWAAGTYNNKHTEIEMKTDLVKVIQSPASPKQIEEARGHLATFLRDSLVGLNYAYYEPPGSQTLHHNPLFVRSHDFSGDSVMGVERLWQAPQLFGLGSPAGGGAHLIGSLADLPYVLAEAEQDFIAPYHVQALIWKEFVSGLLSNAIVPRWWNVSRNELHAVALYQRAGEELLTAAATDENLRGEVHFLLSDRMFPERLAQLELLLRAGQTSEVLAGITPADSFYLTAAFRQKHPAELATVSEAARELETLVHKAPDDINDMRLSRDFGAIHPVFEQSYGLNLVSVRPFPALGGNYGRLMSECWDSGNLYWARLADEKGYDPVLLNRMVPELTRRMVERIYASDIEDTPAVLRALQETGAEFRDGKISTLEGSAGTRN